MDTRAPRLGWVSLLGLACSGSSPSGRGGAPAGDTAAASSALLAGPQGLCADEAAAAPEALPDPEAGGVAVVESSEAAYLRYVDVRGQTVDLPLTEGRAVARGVTPGTDLPVRLLEPASGGWSCSPVTAVPVSALPAGLPEVVLELGTAEDAPVDWVLFPVLTAASRFVVVADASGSLIWAWEPPSLSEDDGPLYRARVTHDGGGVLVNTHASKGGPGALWRVSWDGTIQEELRPATINRDFTELPDGTLAWLGQEVRQFGEGRPLLGDTVVERAPDGTERVVWSLFDDYDHGLGVGTPLADPLEQDAEDWAHANGLRYLPESDDWLVVAPNLHREPELEPPGGILRVDRETGATVWELANRTGDFALSDGIALEGPHSAQLVDGGLLTFNRGAPDSCSRATWIRLDEEAGTASVGWESQNDDCVHVVFLGEALRLPTGETAVMFSSSGRLEFVDEAGDPQWRLAADLGAGFGFVELPELY